MLGNIKMDRTGTGLTNLIELIQDRIPPVCFVDGGVEPADFSKERFIGFLDFSIIWYFRE
jgi:hypothetical protein